MPSSFFSFSFQSLFGTVKKKILGCVLFAIKTPDRPRYEQEGVKDYILRGEEECVLFIQWLNASLQALIISCQHSGCQTSTAEPVTKQKHPPMVTPGTGATPFSLPKVDVLVLFLLVWTVFLGNWTRHSRGSVGLRGCRTEPHWTDTISHRAALNTSDTRDLHFSAVTSLCFSLTIVGAPHRAIGRDFLQDCRLMIFVGGPFIFRAEGSFSSAPGGHNKPECLCCKATSQCWQVLRLSRTDTLGCDDCTAQTTCNWPLLLLTVGSLSVFVSDQMRQMVSSVSAIVFIYFSNKQSHVFCMVLLFARSVVLTAAWTP